MSERSQRLKSPRIRRTIIAGAGLLLGAALAVAWGLSRASTLPLSRLTGSMVIGGLSLLNALLIFALIAVILREGVKLALERQAGRGRFKSRLLFAFTGLALVPALLLPLAAYALVQQSINRWFSASAVAVTDQGHRLLEESYRLLRVRAGAQTAAALDELQRLPPARAPRAAAPPGCAARLRALRPPGQFGLDALAIDFGDGRLCHVHPLHAAQPPADGELRATPDGEARVIERPDGGQWVIARRDRAAAGGATLSAYGITTVDPALSAAAGAMDGQLRAWREEQTRKRDLKALVLSCFLIITLTVALFTVWIAPQVARAVTGPIDRLAEGTARLAAGDLGVEVAREGRGEDELGQLTSAFNEMAARLRAEAETRELQARALQAARERAEREAALLEGLLSHLEAGVLMLDANGALARRNPAAEAILGVPLGPVLGRDPRRDTDGALPWTDVLGTPAGAGARRVTLARDGAPCELEVRATALEGGAKLLLIEEITDLVRAERLGAWQEVAQKLAHEIKNPLTPIQLAAERLMLRGEDAPEPLGGVIRESTAAIREEVVALKRLVDEFSRFARLPPVTVADEPLEPLARSVAELYSGANPVELALTNPPPRARCDAAALRGVLINLLDNARAAAGPAGKIRLSLGRRGERALIEVADDGPGIPAELRGRLFAPFFTTKRGGTGLGLAIAARAVREMGGQLTVDDNPGGGARFTIALPLAGAG